MLNFHNFIVNIYRSRIYVIFVHTFCSKIHLFVFHGLKKLNLITHAYLGD